MLYIDFPVGSAHGWGVCGKYCARELSRLAPTRLLVEQFTPELVGGEFEFAELSRIHMPAASLAAFPRENGVTRLDGPLLECILAKDMLPAHAGLRGSRTVGYTFFEDNIFDPAWAGNARRHFDWVATGSSWCTQVLKEQGLTDVSTVVQGVDHSIFFPLERPKDFFPDRFVVFSGGKIELRKGQDIVMRAYKVLQDRHDDVMLVNSWFNPWPFSVDTMRQSPLIRFQPPQRSYVESINHILADNGIDVARTITLAPCPNPMMARVYRNTDVGLFPNRCEGGTNLVLMEYMACGQPVVASSGTGHADVVTRDNALLVGSSSTTNFVNKNRQTIAVWPEPDLDEAIAQLEWAYQNRDALRRLGHRAGRDLAEWTWARAARDFIALLGA